MKIDHITFVAKSLNQASEYARRTFGVKIPVGGAHPLMGTHNLLTRITPDVFLEFIAIDPYAAPPARARWFALDRLTREGALDEAPRLFGWVASLPGCVQHATRLGAQHPLALSRGDLHWTFCLRDDGEAEEGGAMPHFLEWSEGRSPVDRMPDTGIRLKKLTVEHPQICTLATKFGELGWDELQGSNELVRWSKGNQPGLVAEFDTPLGELRINGGNL